MVFSSYIAAMSFALQKSVHGHHFTPFPSFVNIVHASDEKPSTMPRDSIEKCNKKAHPLQIDCRGWRKEEDCVQGVGPRITSAVAPADGCAVMTIAERSGGKAVSSC